ncbi:hypothetical protein GCM10009795_026290 [Nocardioides hankookensis]
MELEARQYDLLQAVLDLQGDGDESWPSTEAAGLRLLEIYKARGGGHSWMSSPPWHGTSPMADDLRSLGLVELDVGMAEFRRPGDPANSPKMYWLGLTDEGRRVLADRDSGS